MLLAARSRVLSSTARSNTVPGSPLQRILYYNNVTWNGPNLEKDCSILLSSRREVDALYALCAIARSFLL